jgi:ABC-type branched-subunit amino acid transport system substrate-binding protein
MPLKRLRNRQIQVSLVALFAAVSLAACSSSSSTGAAAGSSSTSSTSGGSSSGAAGAPIKIFLDYPGHNPSSPYDDMPAAAEAAVKAVNDAGGVHGSPLDLIVCDNLFTQPASLQCARNAVSDNVVALVGQSDYYTAQTLPVLQAAKIPSVGLYSFGNTIDSESPIVYPVNGGSTQTFLALSTLLANKGVKSFVTQACEFPSCQNLVKLLQSNAPSAGIKDLGNVTVPLTGVTDYSPYVAKTKAFSPTPTDVIQIESAATSEGLIQAAQTVGFKPRYYDNEQALGETTVKQNPTAFEGYYIPGPYPSPRDTTNHGAVQYVSEQAKAADTTPAAWLASQTFGQGWSNSFGAWASVHAFAMAAAKVKGAVTAASLTAVLNNPSYSYDLFGLATWKPGAAGPPSYPRFSTMQEYVVTVKDGQFQTDTPVDPFNVVPLVK